MRLLLQLLWRVQLLQPWQQCPSTRVSAPAQWHLLLLGAAAVGNMASFHHARVGLQLVPSPHHHLHPVLTLCLVQCCHHCPRRRTHCLHPCHPHQLPLLLVLLIVVVLEALAMAPLLLLPPAALVCHHLLCRAAAACWLLVLLLQS